jgi:hypothetical protein
VLVEFEKEAGEGGNVPPGNAKGGGGWTPGF